MHWEKPILTDSGGYQVMSLAKLRRITEEGVTFQSHIDGATIHLTPERAIEVQCLLGADIQMVLDECTPFPATREEAKRSLDLSMRWAERSKAAFARLSAPGQALFGIVQGSTYPDLREQSARALMEIGFPGYAVGGLAVGEGQQSMFDMVEVDDGGSARGPAALPHGRRHAGGSAGRHRPRHRHVRLRDADPLGPPLSGLHLGRAAESAQRPPCRGHEPARRREPMPRRAI